MSNLHCKILTPERILYEGDVAKLIVPTKTGQIGVLPNHIPLMSRLAPGELVIDTGTETIPLVVSAGLIEVQPDNQIVILADTAERIEEIEIERAEEAHRRAEALQKEKLLDSEEYATLAAKLEKEFARIHVGKKYKNLPPRP